MDISRWQQYQETNLVHKQPQSRTNPNASFFISVCHTDSKNIKPRSRLRPVRLPPGAYQGENLAVDLAGDVARVLLRGRQQRLREAEPRAGKPRANRVVGVVGILEVFCATPHNIFVSASAFQHM
jgi:hypothetical protein